MGVYLSTPNVDLSSEVGEGYGIRYAVGEIQVTTQRERQREDSSNLFECSLSVTVSLFLSAYRDGERTWKMLISPQQI